MTSLQNDDSKFDGTCPVIDLEFYLVFDCRRSMQSSPDLIAFKVPAACLVQIYLEMMMGGLQDQVRITHLLSICPS